MICTYSLALGYRVGRVRTLFQLPEECYYPHPLAYIEWYTEFRDRPVPGLEMYKISRSMRQNKPQVAVVRVDSIRRSCHLVPCWGANINRTSCSEDALDCYNSFYVNDFLDMYTYQFFND